MGDETGSDEGIGGGLAVHAVVYLCVNALLIAIWALFTPDASFEQVPQLLTHPSQAKAASFFPIYVIVFWGAGLLIHAGVVFAGAPRRRRARRERSRQERQRRQLQAKVVSALGDGVLAEAAVAGISYVDGDKAAEKVRAQAAAERKRSARDDARRAPAAKATRKKERKDHDRPPKVRSGNDRGAQDRREDPAVAKKRPTKADPPSTAPSASPAAPARTPSRTWVAVLFTDIVDSTPLNQRVGDESWARLLAAHRAMVRAAVADHGGTEVGTQGDGFLVRFATPDQAAACALDLQRRLEVERRDHPAAEPGADRAADRRGDAAGTPAIHVRMGLHAGEAMDDDDDLIGRVVNLAARVTAAAEPDEILVTELFADHLSPGHPLVDRGLRTLKGFDQPRHLLALAWQSADEIVLDT